MQGKKAAFTTYAVPNVFEGSMLDEHEVVISSHRSVRRNAREVTQSISSS